MRGQALLSYLEVEAGRLMAPAGAAGGGGGSSGPQAGGGKPGNPLAAGLGLLSRVTDLFRDKAGDEAQQQGQQQGRGASEVEVHK